MRLVAAITLLAALTPWAAAQRMSGFSPHPGMPAAPGFTGLGPSLSRNGFSGSGFGRGNHGFPGGFAVPFFTDAVYSDLLATGYPAASQPPVFVMQAPPSVAASFPAPKDALMIELQGDRYVLVSGDEKSGAEMQTLPRASAPQPSPKSPGAVVRVSQKETLTATLVYRDGHHEDISDYTIADGAIYAKSDYYKSGAWNRKIELSSLNLPETIQQNQSRGLNFRLPSSPYEVIVGP